MRRKWRSASNAIRRPHCGEPDPARLPESRAWIITATAISLTGAVFGLYEAGLPGAVLGGFVAYALAFVLRLIKWHCRNNCKASALGEEVAQLSGTEFTPLGEGGGAVQLEIFAAVEMALPIEMIVYG